MRPLLIVLLLCLAASAAGQREGTFVGYKEVNSVGAAGDAAAAGDKAKPAGEGDGSLNVAQGADGTAAAAAAAEAGGAGGAKAAVEQAGEQAAAQGAQAAGDALAKAAEVLGRTVLIHTQFGPIRVRLLEKLAPRTTALVWQLAERHGCRDCAFYRNEGRPRAGLGPPYALLQGRMNNLPEVPPHEGNIEVKMGHVCFIPETKDFFIAYGDHPEWGTAHTVWGQVDEWFATDFIISQQWTETTHPEFGTAMRMLKTEVPLRLAVEGDKTYSGLLGPLPLDE